MELRNSHWQLVGTSRPVEISFIFGGGIIIKTRNLQVLAFRKLGLHNAAGYLVKLCWIGRCCVASASKSKKGRIEGVFK